MTKGRVPKRRAERAQAVEQEPSLKRSRYILLGCVAAGGLWLWLASGGDETRTDDPAALSGWTTGDAYAFETPGECTADGMFSRVACAQAFAEAQQRHHAVAPHYDSSGACEAEHGVGNCRSMGSGTTSWFVPAMAGFLVARALDRPAEPLYAPSPAIACPPGVNPAQRPECRTPAAAGSGGGGGGGARTVFRTASGAGVERHRAGAAVIFRPTQGWSRGPATGNRWTLSSSRGTSMARSPGTGVTQGTTVSRGGFGSTGRSFTSSRS